MGKTREREEYLIGLNLRWLRQGVALLEDLGDESYCYRIGPQVRHVIEFYECFFCGVSRRSIDYDSRPRNLLLETSRAAAIAKLGALQAQLASIEVLADCAVWVRVEDSPRGAFVLSSIARELQALSSHTVHHFALVAMMAQMLNVAVDPELGVAPSTFAWRQSQARAEQCVQ